MVCAQVIGHDAAIFWCAAAFVEQSLAMATALAKEASATGRTIREVARERSGISSAELERLLDPRSQT